MAISSLGRSKRTYVKVVKDVGYVKNRFARAPRYMCCKGGMHSDLRKQIEEPSSLTLNSAMISVKHRKAHSGREGASLSRVDISPSVLIM
jgi:hypothetical protein